MSKTRKTVVIAIAALCPLFILIGTFSKLQHWSEPVFQMFVAGGFLLLPVAIFLASKKTKPND